MANATGVRAETMALSPFHPASHASHHARGVGDMFSHSAERFTALVTMRSAQRYGPDGRHVVEQAEGPGWHRGAAAEPGERRREWRDHFGVTDIRVNPP